MARERVVHTGASRQAIQALHLRGWSDSAIGRAVGRDSSLIHQIGIGSKPGRNLSPALQSLADSGLSGPKNAKQVPAVLQGIGEIPTAERRARASGGPARVRAGRLGSVDTFPNGVKSVAVHTKAGARFAAGLARDAGETARIKVLIKTADGKTVVLGRKGGIRPETFAKYMAAHKTPREAYQAMLDDMYPFKAGRGKGGVRVTGMFQVARDPDAQVFITHASTPA